MRSSRVRFAVTLGLLVAFVGAAAGGCATGSDVAAADVLPGVEVTWLRTAPANGRAEWFVRPSGTIEYRGGADSLLGRTTWTGTLTDAQITELTAILEAAGAFPAGLTDGPEPGVETEVTLRHPLVDRGRRRTLEAAGDPPNAADLLAFLRSASSARFREVLDRLPKPGAGR